MGLKFSGWAVVPIAVFAILGGCGGGDDGGFTEPGPVCTFGLSPASRAFDASGGTGQVAVSTADGCAWSTTAGASWITVTDGASGSGAGTVAYSVAPNTTADARSSGLTIGGQVHQVTQQGRAETPCTYSLSPENADFDSPGGTGSFTVTTGADCSWTAGSNASWLSITSSAQRTGPGTVAYSVGRNETTDPRLAVITVEGKTFTVRQSPAAAAACEYSVTPVTLTPCMPSGTSAATVTTQAACAWTASSNVPWLSIAQGSSGSGSGTITFSYTANYDAPRDGIVMVRWATPTAGQNIHIAQAGCRYGVSPASFAIAAAGGSGSFEVVQQSDPAACGGPLQNACIWSAASDASWITITSPMPRTGDNPVAFTIAPNTTGAARTGRITVRDQVVVVTQSGT